MMVRMAIALAAGDDNSKMNNGSGCYVLVERSARLELDGYGSVAWHVVLEAYASDTR